jgi:L-threonylcarbamoyladenylate synthase
MATVSTDISEAKKYLEEGLVIGVPTETVYGLAGNALNELAVTCIFSVKNRPSFDPLIVHSSSIEQVDQFVASISDKALALAQRFWPGPLTLLLPKKDIIPDLVTSGLDHVAVRIPNHPLTLQLLSMLDFPLAAPSANPFGYISPTTAAHVQAQLGKKIPFILDGGASRVGIESTIIGFENDHPIVYRLGGIAVEAIEEVVGKVRRMAHSTSDPRAPGMLKSHYAPRKPFFIDHFTSLLQQYTAQQIGFIGFTHKRVELPEENQLILSEQADISEAARKLFSAMRQLDGMPVEVIFAELLPEKELGRAVNDRLRRAAAK